MLLHTTASASPVKYRDTPAECGGQQDQSDTQYQAGNKKYGVTPKMRFLVFD